MAQRSWGNRYAIVASSLALMLALGGTAYAADTVFSTDIVDGEVKTEDIAASSLGHSPRLWAQIRANGSRIRGTAVAASRPAPGRYTVTFGRTVTTCAVSVTPVASGPRTATTQRSGAVVTVRTFAANGTASNTAFDIVLVC